MHILPEDLKLKFLKGEHTMHHKPGIFNGIWSDMAIETTYMRYGKSKNGLIGLTMNPESFKTWAYSRHACSQVVQQLRAVRDNDSDSMQLKHAEESLARICNDGKDRANIRTKLEACINPLDPEQLSPGLVNIVTGKIIDHPSVNVDGAVEHGKMALDRYKEKLPEGFYDTIPKVVQNMSSVKKHVKIGESKVINTELVYARAMALNSSDREVDTDNLLAYELSPLPTSMFADDGQMRQSVKSNLKKSLAVEVDPSVLTESIDFFFLDGCAILWAIPWPHDTRVQDYITNFRSHLSGYLKKGDVYLVFDRYITNSTKEHTRNSRDKAASRKYSLTSTSQLPSRTVTLTVAANKAQLIDLICEDFEINPDGLDNTLYITGKAMVPSMIHNGNASRCINMATTQEEADTIIIQQLARLRYGTALVVADDTDIFLLLLNFVNDKSITCKVFMSAAAHGKAIIDIAASVVKHKAIIPNLLAAHALTGCDTVAATFGIGKLKAVKVLRSKNQNIGLLGQQGDTSDESQGAFGEAMDFMLACYGKANCMSLTEARKKVWADKVSRARAAAPAIASLPPTDEAFYQNFLRAAFQLSIWLGALKRDPPPLDPLKYGWTQTTNGLEPTHVADGVELVPEELLKLIRCACKSQIPCKDNRCSCRHASMTCTVFCGCNESCQNAPISQNDCDDHSDDEN